MGNTNNDESNETKEKIASMKKNAELRIIMQQLKSTENDDTINLLFPTSYYCPIQSSPIIVTQISQTQSIDSIQSQKITTQSQQTCSSVRSGGYGKPVSTPG